MLIGVTGRAGAGKDTVADIVESVLPKVSKYSFAKPIYDLAEEWLGLKGGYYSREVKESLIVIKEDTGYYKHLASIIYANFKQFGVSPVDADEIANRIYHEFYNHEIYEKGLGSFWIASPRKILQVIGTEGFREFSDSFWVDIAPKEDVVIADVRFENEATFIRDNGGFIIHVERPEEGIATIKEAGHASEAGIKVDPLDYTVVNDSSIEDLKYTVIDILSKRSASGT